MAQLILWNSIDDKNILMRPLGTYAIAKWLTMHGYDVKVIDFGYHLPTKALVELTKKHITNDTVAIGVGSTFWPTKIAASGSKVVYLEPDWVIAARSELTHLNVDWLLGGAQSYMEFPKYFDWTFIHNEGEDPILKYMDEKTGKNITREPFNITNCRHSYLEGNDIKPYEFLSMELGRGCQFKCKFCRYPAIGKKAGTYIRDIDYIKQELLENYYKFGTTRYLFVDDTVNESDEKIIDLANLAATLPFKLQWVGFMRLDLIGSRPHMIDILKESGLISTFFGIESFHPIASKLVGKGWNGKYGKDFILELSERWNNEINLCLGLISGIKGETEDDIWETHNWCIKNNIAKWQYNGLQITSHKFQYLSEFDRNAAMYGYRLKGHDKNPDYWECDGWTWDTANKIAQESRRDMNKHSRPAGWSVGELWSVGMFDDIKTLMNTKAVDLPWQLIQQNIKNRVKDYIDNQLK